MVVVVYLCLAEARTNLKHSVLSKWTMLLFKWFQAMIVLGKKECLYCLVLQCGMCTQGTVFCYCVVVCVCVGGGGGVFSKVLDC